MLLLYDRLTEFKCRNAKLERSSIPQADGPAIQRCDSKFSPNSRSSNSAKRLGIKVIVHEISLAHAEGASQATTLQVAVERSLQALKDDPEFLSRNCDCRTRRNVRNGRVSAAESIGKRVRTRRVAQRIQEELKDVAVVEDLLAALDGKDSEGEGAEAEDADADVDGEVYEGELEVTSQVGDGEELDGEEVMTMSTVDMDGDLDGEEMEEESLNYTNERKATLDDESDMDLDDSD